jgi:hypothetical protein
LPVYVPALVALGLVWPPGEDASAASARSSAGRRAKRAALDVVENLFTDEPCSAGSGREQKLASSEIERVRDRAAETALASCRLEAGRYWIAPTWVMFSAVVGRGRDRSAAGPGGV